MNARVVVSEKLGGLGRIEGVRKREIDGIAMDYTDVRKREIER